MNQYVGTVPSTFQLLYHFCSWFMLILQGVGPWKREPPIFPQFCFVRGLEKKSSNNMRYQIGKTTIHDDIHIYIPNIYLQNWINKPYHPIKKIQGAPFFVLSKTRFFFQPKQPTPFAAQNFFPGQETLLGTASHLVKTITAAVPLSSIARAM